MKLSSYLTAQYVVLDADASTIEGVIGQAVDKFALKNEKIRQDAEGIKKALLERETKMSTAIGAGIAIPHARIEDFRDFIAGIAILKNPIMMPLADTGEEDEVKIVVFMISDSINNALILSVMSDFVKLAKSNPELVKDLKASTRAAQVLKLLDKTNIELSHDLIAEDVMQEGVAIIKPENTLEEVEDILLSQNASGLPVVNQYGDFLGEISEKELIGYGMPQYPEFEDMDFVTVGKPFKEYCKDKKVVKAGDICKIDEKTVIKRETSIMEICFLIANKGLRRLYVVENNKYVGMINSFEILKKLQKYN